MIDERALEHIGNGALVAGSAAQEPALLAWANTTTDPDSPCRAGLLRDKTNAVRWFFVWHGKPPAAVAGLAHLYLHQTRHTYARIVMEASESLHAVQEAGTTRDWLHLPIMSNGWHRKRTTTVKRSLLASAGCAAIREAYPTQCIQLNRQMENIDYR